MTFTMQAIHPSKIFVTIYQITCHYIPKEWNVIKHQHESFIHQINSLYVAVSTIDLYNSKNIF